MTSGKEKIDTAPNRQALILREARPEDNGQICAVMRRNAMPGRISLTSDCSPSFFDAATVEGYRQRAILAESGREIVGVGLVSARKVFFNGRPTEVGYIGSVRLDPPYRGKTIVYQGVEVVKQWHEETFGVPFYLCAILGDNTRAQNVLKGGQGGWPAYRHVGKLYTAALPLIPRPKPAVPPGLRMARGVDVGAGEIAAFLERVGREKQFFPVYTAEDIQNDEGVLRGLGLEDFYVVLEKGRIRGVLACWNQLPFKRILVAGYAGYLRAFRFLVAPFVKALRLAPIPAPGRPLRNLYAACLAVEENDPRIFTALLGTALCGRHDTGFFCLLVSLMESDPLLPHLKKYLHFPTQTDIYAFSWRHPEALDAIEPGISYLEQASL
ncbi:MAG: GNAT family N-acetyltransferase [Deltaproteobacteria bacterium]|nr:GNAT family N-acetyltransferase [Deltaproteobacteria bacterium]